MPIPIPSPMLLAASLFVLAACGESEEAATPAIGALGWPSTRTTDRGNFEVTIQPNLETIGRNEHFSLDVTLVDKKGNAGDVSVVVNAGMPAHRHGMNTRPEVIAESPMRYRVDGMLFHMSGDWVITVDVTRSGGESERASFPVSIE